MKVLFLSRWFPYPINNGSKLRIYNLLRGLAKHHETTLLTFADQPAVNLDEPKLQALHCQVQVVPWKSYTAQSARAQVGFLRLTPRSIVDTFSLEMAQRIQQTLLTQSFDLIIASQLDTAAYAPYFQGVPALYEEIEIGTLYEQFAQARSLRLRLRYGLTWWKHRHYLARQLRYFQACTVASERERQLVESSFPNCNTVEVIPNCIQVSDYQAADEAEPDTLIFTGPFGYRANYEAMVWFLREVYPLIQAQRPQIRLTITGDHADLPLPPATNVTLTGFVDDIRPLIARSWISLAPLQTGGGTRLKILEAMALGTPVVATGKGAEGLDITDGEQILIGDTPTAFAQAVIRLCEEPGLRQRLANHALSVVQEKYDWTATLPQFLQVVDQVAAGKTKQRAALHEAIPEQTVCKSNF